MIWRLCSVGTAKPILHVTEFFSEIIAKADHVAEFIQLGGKPFGDWPPAESPT